MVSRREDCWRCRLCGIVMFRKNLFSHFLNNHNITKGKIDVIERYAVREANSEPYNVASLWIFCPECGEKVLDHSRLAKHCEKLHKDGGTCGQPQDYTVFTECFDTYIEFEKWLSEKSERTCTSLICQSSAPGRNEFFMRCHRAGIHICGLSKGTGEMNQSKRQAKNCSCFLNVRLHDSGAVIAKGCFGHIGHKLEVSLLHLTSKQELFLKELLEKHSIDFILNRLQHEYSPKTSRLASVDRKDLWNLIRRYQIVPVPTEPDCPKNVMPLNDDRRCSDDDDEEEQDCDSEDNLPESSQRPPCPHPRPTQASAKRSKPILLKVEGKRVYSAKSLPSTSQQTTKFTLEQIERNLAKIENLLRIEECETLGGSYPGSGRPSACNNQQKIFKRPEEEVPRKDVHTIATVEPRSASTSTCSVTNSGRAPLIVSRSTSLFSPLQMATLLPKRPEAPHLVSPKDGHNPALKPSCPPSQQTPASGMLLNPNLLKVEGKRVYSVRSLPSTSQQATVFSVEQIQRNLAKTENLRSMEECETLEGSYPGGGHPSACNNQQKILKRPEEEVPRKDVHTIVTVEPQSASTPTCSVTNSGRAPLIVSRSTSLSSPLQMATLLPKRPEASHLVSPKDGHNPVLRPSCPPSQRTSALGKQTKPILVEIVGQTPASGKQVKPVLVKIVGKRPYSATSLPSTSHQAVGYQIKQVQRSSVKVMKKFYAVKEDVCNKILKNQDVKVVLNKPLTAKTEEASTPQISGDDRKECSAVSKEAFNKIANNRNDVEVVPNSTPAAESADASKKDKKEREPGILHCKLCTKKLYRKSLYSHLRNVHFLREEEVEDAKREIAIESFQKTRGDSNARVRRCPICDEVVVDHPRLAEHCDKCHRDDGAEGTPQDYRLFTVTFESHDEFEHWLDKECERTCTTFVRRTCTNGNASSSYTLRCHRSGPIAPKVKPKKTKKLPKDCSCFMYVHINKKGQVTAHGCFGHAGHDINVALLRRTRSQELYLKDLLEHYSMNDILDILKEQFSPEKSKLYHVTQKDLWTIVNKYDIPIAAKGSRKNWRRSTLCERRSRKRVREEETTEVHDAKRSSV